MYKSFTPPCSNSEKTVSVIIPAYNSEKTISKIVTQVLQQTYPAAEIIIVDDGSIEGTASIIDKFQTEHSGIVKAIHQSNAGVSAARNTGMDTSSGKYITFLDSDDEVGPDYIKNLISAIIQDNSDMAISGYVKIPHGDVNLKRAVFDKTEYQNVIMTRNIGVPFGKIFDGDIIRQNDIRFPVGMKASEDAVFYYRYLLHSNRCSFVNKADYVYYAPANGKSYGANIDEKIIGLTAMGDALIALLENLKLDYEGKERLRQRLVLTLNMVLYAISELPYQQRNKAYRKINWSKYIDYLRADLLTKHFLRTNKLKLFEIDRLLQTKCLRRSISEIIL